MTLDEEITYWKEQASSATTDAWLIAFGVYVGLLIAKQKRDESLH